MTRNTGSTTRVTCASGCRPGRGSSSRRCSRWTEGGSASATTTGRSSRTGFGTKRTGRSRRLSGPRPLRPSPSRGSSSATGVWCGTGSSARCILHGRDPRPGARVLPATGLGQSKRKEPPRFTILTHVYPPNSRFKDPEFTYVMISLTICVYTHIHKCI